MVPFFFAALTYSLILTVPRTSCHTEETSLYWENLQSLLYNLTVTDNDDPADFKDRFSTALSQYCFKTDTLNDSFVCDVIRSFLKLSSRLIKETLASTTPRPVRTLSFDDIQNLRQVLQYQDLLLTSLELCPFDINTKSCPGDSTPLEYAISTHQFNSALQLLLMERKEQAVISVSADAIKFSIACQNEKLLKNILTHTRLNSVNIDCSIISIASIHSWSGDWGTHVRNILTKALQTTDENSDVINGCLPHINNFPVNDAGMMCVSPILSDGYSHLSMSMGINDFILGRKSYHVSKGGWLAYEHDPPPGVSECQIPVINGRALNVSAFSELLKLRIPLLLNDVPYFPKLRSLWKKTNLKEQFGDIDVLAGPIPYGEIFGEVFGVASIAEFLTYMDEYSLKPVNFNAYEDVENAQLPLYIFDGQVMDEVFSSFFKMPDLYSLWNESNYFHQFILGPRGSGAPFHFHCSAMNYLAYGRKKWFLYPPGKAIYSKFHPLHWYWTSYEHLSSIDMPIECTQESGQILYVPSGWSHSTLNVDECIGLATEFDTNNC